MNKFLLLALGLYCCGNSSLVMAQHSQKTIEIEVKNSWTEAKTDEPVVLPLDQFKLPFAVRSAVVTEQSTEIPSQLDDLTGDRRPDELAFVSNFKAGERKTFRIVLSAERSKKSYSPRVYAEMLVSDKKGKHVPVQSVSIPGSSNIYSQLHHHGPALESELVSYRLYFDQKQTIDIYGKFNKGFEIQESQFYPTDEQLARGFGDDVLMVGASCGAGAFKGWNGTKATHIEPVELRTERIIAYGPVRVIAEIEDNNWSYQHKELNMTVRHTLWAGHRDLTVDVLFEETLSDETFCTGVEDIRGSISSSDHQGLVGCWGTDWPVNDTVKYAKETVGLATYIPKRYVKKEVKDPFNYLYLVGAKGENRLRYHTSFTSRKERFGYPTAEAWFAHIRHWKESLEHPVSLKINH